MILEFGFGQAEAVRSLASAAGWRTMSIRPDLQGIERVGTAWKVVGARRTRGSGSGLEGQCSDSGLELGGLA